MEGGVRCLLKVTSRRHVTHNCSCIFWMESVRFGRKPRQNTYRCSVLCSKNTSVYIYSQFVRVFRTSHGFLFSRKRLSPFSFLNSLLFFPTSIFPTAPKIWTLVHQKLARVCSSCIRLLNASVLHRTPYLAENS